MMTKPASAPPSVLLKVAGTMHRMGIEGLPRNYELVYEAMSGARPDLTRAFLALGPVKSQAALDALGRQHLPHHHENEMLNRSTSVVREELGGFLDLVHREASSLKHFGNLLEETSRRLSVERDAMPPALGNAVRTISAATALKAAQGQVIADEAAERSSRLQKVAGDLAAFEKLKLADPLTRLPNRRAFDRELAARYAVSGAPALAGLAVCDIDNFAAINERYQTAAGDVVIAHVARIIERHMAGSIFAARTGGGQFGFIVSSGLESAIVRFCEQVRVAIAMTPLTIEGHLPAHLTVSFGLCMAEFADDPVQLVGNTTTALGEAKAAGRNRTHVYVPPESQKLVGNDWMIYKP